MILPVRLKILKNIQSNEFWLSTRYQRAQDLSIFSPQHIVWSIKHIPISSLINTSTLVFTDPSDSIRLSTSVIIFSTVTKSHWWRNRQRISRLTQVEIDHQLQKINQPQTLVAPPRPASSNFCSMKVGRNKYLRRCKLKFRTVTTAFTKFSALLMILPQKYFLSVRLVLVNRI